MDAPSQTEMVEGKVSKVVEAVSEGVHEAVSMITGKKKEEREGLEAAVYKFFEEFGIVVGGEKGDYSVINQEEASKFYREIATVSTTERMNVPLSRFLHWAFVVHDYNRMHIFPGYAADAGFKKLPTHGTLIAACQEQYILSLLDNFNKFFKNLNEKYNLIGDKAYKEFVYSNHNIKFEKPLFPKRKKTRINWNLDNIVKKNGNIKLEISALNLDQEVVLSSSIILAPERRKLDPSEQEKFYKYNDVVEKSNIEIKRGEIKEYYFCIGKKYSEGASIFMMHSAAFIPATLLRLSSRRTGTPEGTYRTMEFEFYDSPKEGIFETRIRMPNPPRKVEDGNTGKVGYAYKFKTLCLQDKKPVVGGDVVCFSPYEFEVPRYLF